MNSPEPGERLRAAVREKSPARTLLEASGAKLLGVTTQVTKLLASEKDDVTDEVGSIQQSTVNTLEPVDSSLQHAEADTLTIQPGTVRKLTAAAVAAVAAAEMGAEEETLERLEVSVEAAYSLSLAFKMNATKEARTVRTLKEVASTTAQQSVLDDLEQGIKAREAYIDAGKAIALLSSILQKSRKDCKTRLSSASKRAQRAAKISSREATVSVLGSPASRGTSAELANQLLPEIERKSRESAFARRETAEKVATLRARAATQANLCQSILPPDQAALVFCLLLDVAKIEAVVSLDLTAQNIGFAIGTEGGAVVEDGVAEEEVYPPEGAGAGIVLEPKEDGETIVMSYGEVAEVKLQLQSEEMVIDVGDSAEMVTSSGVNWGTVLLRLVDLILFFVEELFKFMRFALPIGVDVVTTAASRTTEALGRSSSTDSSDIRRQLSPDLTSSTTSIQTPKKPPAKKSRGLKNLRRDDVT